MKKSMIAFWGACLAIMSVPLILMLLGPNTTILVVLSLLIIGTLSIFIIAIGLEIPISIDIDFRNRRVILRTLKGVSVHRYVA